MVVRRGREVLDWEHVRASAGSRPRYGEAFILIRVLGSSAGWSVGYRPGVREARESAQRILDDLVQGHALLFRQRRLPIEVRSQTGTLPVGRPRAPPEAGRVLIGHHGSFETAQRFRRRYP